MKFILLKFFSIQKIIGELDVIYFLTFNNKDFVNRNNLYHLIFV